MWRRLWKRGRSGRQCLSPKTKASKTSTWVEVPDPIKIIGLVKPSCLIIYEIGRCVFDKECTRLFFDLVGKRYEKAAPNCMIMTSNKQPGKWAEYFKSDDDLSAALDRLFDEAKVITIKGESYRGRNLEVIAVEAGTVAGQDA